MGELADKLNANAPHMLRKRIAELEAVLAMMALAFDDWEEPTHNGTREWCSRFSAYLRGNVIAQATFTPEEWTQVRAIREGAKAAKEEG